MPESSTGKVATQSEGASTGSVGDGSSTGNHFRISLSARGDAASGEGHGEGDASPSAAIKRHEQQESSDLSYETIQQACSEPKPPISDSTIHPPERTPSNSSTTAIPDTSSSTAAHQSGYPPLGAPQNDRTQFSVGAPRLSADSMSIGSVPSGLDSVGGVSGCVAQHSAQSQQPPRPNVGAALHALAPTPPPPAQTQQQRRQQQQQQSTPIQSTPTPRQELIPQTQQNQHQGQNIPMAPQLNNGALQTQEQTVPGTHHPVLVAVPLQQTADEPVSQQTQQQMPTETENGQQQQQQHQQQQQSNEQTLYYQIPSVVTCVPSQGNQSGMINSTYASQEEQQPYPSGLQQPNLPQQPIQGVVHNAPEQVIGMVGTIPIVKLQTGSLHLVKKKKGRFKLLGDSPAVATNAIVGGAPVVGVVSTPSAAAPQQLPTNTLIPTNIAIPTQGRSMSSQISQFSTVMPAPQTFDGTSAPTVKKKGRFVVTNVKDPGSIPLNLQHPQAQTPPSLVEASGQQQILPPNQPQANQRDPVQSQQQQLQHQMPQRENQALNNGHQSMGPQHERSISSVPSSEMQQGYAQDHPQTMRAPGPSAVYAYQTQGFIQQPAAFYQLEEVGGPRYNVAEHVQQQPPPPPPPTNQGPVDGLSQISVAQNLDPNRPQPTLQYATPPSTPGAAASAPNSPRRTQAAVAVPQAANTIPKVPPSSDKMRNQTTRKKPVQSGTGKLPQTIDKNGNVSTVGLGKVFYLLDQMKTEVSGADRTIKTLQTDMKLLRDKNKELEAKVRELESKLKEEKGLREKAEARSLELRKRIRDTKEVTASKPVDQQPEDGAVARSVEMHSEKAVISDVGKDKTVNGVNPAKKSASGPAANVQASAGGGSASAAGEKIKVPVPPKVATVPTKSAAPPLPGKPVKQHMRSQSYSQESKLVVDRSTTEATPTPTKATPASNPRLSDNPGAVSTRPPPVYPNIAVSQHGPTVPKLQRVSDFDPLKPNSSSGPTSHESEIMPLISLSTPVSLEAVPLNSAPAYFQNPNANAGSPYAAQFNPGPFLGDNQYVVPITLGMAPAAVGQGMNGDIHQSSGSTHAFHGLQQQPIMVLPQQQPIMFQQFGGMHDGTNVVTGQHPNVPVHQNPNQPVYVHENPSQAQSPSHGGYPNPFDAFSDPFDDLVPRQVPNQ